MSFLPSTGCETINLSKIDSINDGIEAILGTPYVDYVGNEVHGLGQEAEETKSSYAINQVLDATRPGGATGIIGFYGANPISPVPAERQGIYFSTSVMLGLNRLVSPVVRHWLCITTTI